MIKNFTHKHLLIFLLLASIFALSIAYISQYFFELQPCILCLHQRKPFFAIIILTIFALFISKKKAQKIFIYLAILLILINVGIAFYHSGVERKIFAGPSTCTESQDIPNNLEDLKKSIEQTKPVRCDQPAFIFLGLSMAEYNLIYCLFLAGTSLLILRKIK